MTRYATYVRVSTQKQGRSGLGLDAQREMCSDYIQANNGEFTREFMDVESGTHRDRKGLMDAILYCKSNDCSLVIAKLDRLARDVEFCFKVVNTGIDIHFTDMPQMNTLLLGVFASVAQYERELTSERTKKALSVKKAQGAKLGAANELYRQNYAKKDTQKKNEENMRRGFMKRQRFQESRDVTAFLKILARTFPSEDGGVDWGEVNTQYDNRIAMLSLMRDYKSLDADLFRSWDLEKDLADRSLQTKLANMITSVRKSLKIVA